jgi:hypothetical protein
MGIPPNLIRQQGQLLHGYTHNRKRAGELAAEVEMLNRAVAAQAEDVTFEDEPSSFVVIHRRGKARRSGGTT